MAAKQKAQEIIDNNAVGKGLHGSGHRAAQDR
jgi:hypothetical protein